MYSDRDRIQTGRESQTKDLTKTMEERANRITELPGMTEAAWIERQ